MRKLGLCTAVALLFSASNAFALTATLGTGGNYVVNPGGGTLDLTVELSRLPADPNLAGCQMSFTADAPGITIVGAVGGTGNAGTGTRYNDPEWDSSTGGTAFSPNGFSGPMAAGTPKGLYGSGYLGGTGNNPDGVFDTASTIVGHLVITYPAGLVTPVHLNPTGVDFVDEFFGDNAGTEIGITLVPEPASALLLLGALPFLRRRRTA